MTGMQHVDANIQGNRGPSRYPRCEDVRRAAPSRAGEP